MFVSFPVKRCGAEVLGVITVCVMFIETSSKLGSEPGLLAARAKCECNAGELGAPLVSGSYTKRPISHCHCLPTFDTQRFSESRTTKLAAPSTLVKKLPSPRGSNVRKIPSASG